MRFTVLSDEGRRLGTVSFENGRFVADDFLYEAVVERTNERFSELRSTGDFDDLERLIRATLEGVSAETAIRFVRDPDD